MVYIGIMLLYYIIINERRAHNHNGIIQYLNIFIYHLGARLICDRTG